MEIREDYITMSIESFETFLNSEYKALYPHSLFYPVSTREAYIIICAIKNFFGIDAGQMPMDDKNSMIIIDKKLSKANREKIHYFICGLKMSRL